MWRNVLLAHDLLRTGVAAVDRVLGDSNGSDADPQVWMALTEASQATYRALVKLSEARQILADRSAELPRQKPLSEPGAVDQRRLIEEVRARLFEITDTLAKREIKASELRQDADELSNVMHRIEWLADISAWSLESEQMAR